MHRSGIGPQPSPGIHQQIVLPQKLGPFRRPNRANQRKPRDWLMEQRAFHPRQILTQMQRLRHFGPHQGAQIVQARNRHHPPDASCNLARQRPPTRKPCHQMTARRMTRQIDRTINLPGNIHHSRPNILRDRTNINLGRQAITGHRHGVTPLQRPLGQKGEIFRRKPQPIAAMDNHNQAQGRGTGPENLCHLPFMRPIAPPLGRKPRAQRFGPARPRGQNRIRLGDIRAIGIGIIPIGDRHRQAPLVPVSLGC